MINAFLCIWESIVNLSEPLLLFLFLYNKLGASGFKRILAVIFVVILAFTTSLLNDMGLEYFPTIAIGYVEFVLYSLLLFNGRLSMRIVIPTLMIFVVIINNAIITNVLSLFTAVMQESIINQSWVRFAVTTVYMLLDTAFVFLLIKLIDKEIVVPRRIAYGLVFVCILSMTGLYFLIDITFVLSSVNRDTVLCSVASGILIVLIVSMLFLFHNLNTVMKQYSESREEAAVLKRENAHNSELVHISDSIRQIRHDYSSHFSVIAGLVDREDMPGLKDYLRDYQSEYGKVERYALTGNNALDSLLMSKLMICDAENIKTTVTVAFFGYLPLTSVELASMFGNLIDNAVNACRVVDNNNRFINISVRRMAKMLNINVTNSMNAACQKPAHSSNEHGLGIPRIRSIVNKYDGVCSFNALENKFEADILLPLVTEGSSAV